MKFQKIAFGKQPVTHDAFPKNDVPEIILPEINFPQNQFAKKYFSRTFLKLPL